VATRLYDSAAAAQQVDDQGHRRDDEQDVQGECGYVKEQKATHPEQDQDNRKRQPHCQCTLR
jgi:hypothetical protein